MDQRFDFFLKADYLVFFMGINNNIIYFEALALGYLKFLSQNYGLQI